MFPKVSLPVNVQKLNWRFSMSQLEFVFCIYGISNEQSQDNFNEIIIVHIK